jgi:hypothetical protein
MTYSKECAVELMLTESTSRPTPKHLSAINSQQKTADTSTWACWGGVKALQQIQNAPAQRTPGCHKNTDSSDILPALRCFHNTSEIIEATSAAPRLQPTPAYVETCIYTKKINEKVLAARVAGAAALLSGNTSLKHT